MAPKAYSEKSGSFSAFYINEPISKKTYTHYHDLIEVCFFVKADLEVFIKDMRYEIHDGSVMFINNFDIHQIIYNDITLNCASFVAYFRKDFIISVLRAAGAEDALDYLKSNRCSCIDTSLKQRSNLEYLFKNLVHSYSSSESTAHKEAIQKSYLILLLVHVTELFKNYSHAVEADSRHVLIKNVVRFVDENYMFEISLDLLEENFFINKFHLSHLFKEITTFSIMNYVQQRRVIEAQKMLNDADKKIIDICFECGFNNLQHFYRVFKKISGVTPNHFRKLR